MNSTYQQHLNDKDHTHDCCCCCCQCCCYHQQNNNNNNNNNTNDQIPPWLPDDPLMPTINSICSCCSCISSTHVPEKDSSTGCTTPIDLIKEMLREDESDMEKQRRKKLHAIEELLQTERDYIQDLSYLVEVCLEVLSRQQWLAPNDKSIIIRNSHDILAFHRKFIGCHEGMSVYNDNWSFIAKAFLDQIGQFSLYTHYCDLHAEAWTLISEYRDRPEWANFLKECATLDSHSIPLNLRHIILLPEEQQQQQQQHQQQQQQQQKKLHFEDYLIKPVQRICRYQLLIKEIIRYTPPQAPEYDLWSSALSEMQDIVTEIDDRKLEREMKERTDRFIQRLDSDWRISKRHVSQLGHLLIAGGIEVTYSALGQSVAKPRYLGCFIFQTYIIMVRPKKVTSYEPKHWFPLRMADFEELTDIEGQREHSFVVRCKKHTFAFSASCLQEKQLWVKKLQEAIVAAKIEASDENLSAQDFIVSSLPGITSKRSPQSIRLSRSFTNILDMTLAGGNNSNNNNSSSGSSPNQSMSSPDRKLLRRSASTSIQFEDIIKMTRQQPPLPILTKPTDVKLKKRYSADYSSYRRSESSFTLKPRNNSEMYIKPESFGGARRQSSAIDLLSAANNTSMIGKMSLQFKSNHQNALRVTVDHKLRDVCTQEYLSSRAWHMRDQSIDLLSNQSSVSNSPVSGDILKKRKSTSFIRSSASSFSIIIPKRAGDSTTAPNKLSATKLHHTTSEFDIQSNSSSCGSSIHRSLSPMSKSNLSRGPSSSSKLLRRISKNQGCLSESPLSFDSEYSVASNQKRLQRSPSRRQIFVGKVLRRIASLHQKSPSPTSFYGDGDDEEEDVDFNQVKKAVSVDAKRNRKKWRQQELHTSDRPISVTDTKDGITLTAFAYASTPPPTLRKKTEGSKWKNRLSLIRPASFLRLSNDSVAAVTAAPTTPTTII